MDATDRSTAQGPGTGRPPWLLLIHQLPPKPDYLRVKVRRRLKGVGAVQLKSTVYALPNDDESMEDFTWILREIEDDGGTAMLAEASFVDGITDEEVSAMITAEQSPNESDPGREVDSIEPGTTWVTREGIFVDRIASAWLIRRFIDQDATFRFVPARGYKPRRGEIRFDMFHAEYTHEGGDCTFQTLLKRFGLNDKRLHAIGEIVHDIDCKDDRFERPETTGVMKLLRGIADSTKDDGQRLERGSALFEDLFVSFGKART